MTHNILVVDDEPKLCDLLASALGQNEVQVRFVVVAESGVEFVALGKAVFDDPSQAAAIVTRVNAELDEKAPRFGD